ncbi:MAG: alpha/beta hydrolase [Polyangiales bacterium]
MKKTNIASVLQRNAMQWALSSPRLVRERLSIPPREYDGASLDDTERLILGMQKTARIPAWNDLPPPRSRALFDRSGVLLAPRSAPLESVTDLSLDGADGATLSARAYRPYGLDRESPALVYFHGGGFVIGSIASHDPVCRMLAATAGCQVISVEYRLAPEHPFPAANNDAIAAFRAVIRRANELSIDPSKVAVGGDSAGGYLSAQVAIATARDERRPALQLLFYPAADFTMSQPSIRALGEGLFLEERTMRWFLDHFVPSSVDRASPEVSPLRQPVEALRGLPPAHVQTAGFDPLRDEGLAYANKLREAGVEVEHKHYPTLVHGYLNIAGVVVAAVAPYFDAASALRRAFKGA